MGLVGRRKKADKIHRVQLKLREDFYLSIKAFADHNGLNVTQVLEMGATLMLKRGKPLPAQIRGTR